MKILEEIDELTNTIAVFESQNPGREGWHDDVWSAYFSVEFAIEDMSEGAAKDKAIAANEANVILFERMLARLRKTAHLDFLEPMETQAGRLDYYEYINSPEWYAKSDAAKARAGYRCQVCNSTRQLNTHHRTYERLGRELDTDLIVLCRDCHDLFHKQGKLAK